MDLRPNHSTEAANSTLVCPNCGAPHQSPAAFCEKCGTALDNTPPSQNGGPSGETQAPAPRPWATPKLWAVIAAVAVLLIGAGAFFAANSLRATTMHLLRAEGTVDVSDEEGEAVKVRENLGLYGGYQVGTQSKSFAWIDLDEVKLTKLDQNSGIKINKEYRHLEIEVLSGGLFFNITQPLAEEETLNIRTSTMLVGIRGTCGWVEDDGASGARVFILEGTVEAEAVKTGETVAVSAGEMGRVTVNEAGEAVLEVVPFAEEYVAPFVLDELEEDGELTAAVLAASGLDVLDPTDPAERLRAERQALITGRPVLDGGAAEGASYTRDGVTYASEGLSEALSIDLDGDGTQETVLVTRKSSGSPGFAGTIIRLEVYGEAMGHIRKLDEAAGTEFPGPEPETLQLCEKDGQRFLYLGYGEYDDSGFYLCGLEDGRLTLSEAHPWEEFNESEYTWLDSKDYTGELSVPGVPEDIQRKSRYLAHISSPHIGPPTFAKLCDIDGDGAEELLTLDDYGNFNAYAWDGSELQPTLLQSDVSYARLIDMDQDGTEELLLLTDSEPFPFKVYSWGEAGMQNKELEYRPNYFEYNIYREKTTGIIYVGGLDGGGSRGEHTTLCSLTDTLELSWSDHSMEINRIWDSSAGDELTAREEDAIRAEEDAAEQEYHEYSTQLARFELIERIAPHSYGWEDSLTYTVEEVKQQLAAR